MPLITMINRQFFSSLNVEMSGQDQPIVLSFLATLNVQNFKIFNFIGASEKIKALRHGFTVWVFDIKTNNKDGRFIIIIDGTVLSHDNRDVLYA